MHIAAIGADYFLIQDLPGYQGMLDTGTAASNLTWEGRLHTGQCYHCFCRQSVPWLIISGYKTRLVTRACLTQEQQPPENFARVDYFLIQDSPGYQDMLDTGTATRTSRGRVGCHTDICFFTFQTSSSGMPVPPMAFPWPFKFASGGARTCAKPSDQSRKGISSTVTGVWPGGSRFQMGVLTNHLGSIIHFVFSSWKKSHCLCLCLL